MKLVAAIMLICSLHVTAKSVSQTITLSGKDLPLQTILTEIEKQSGYYVIYDKDVIITAAPVTVDAKEEPLLQFLDQVLQNKGFDYVIENKTIAVRRKQEEIIKKVLEKFDPPVTGIVRGPDGQPLAGANVMIKGTTKGTVTDKDGKFVIEVNEGQVLEITSIGFGKKELTVSSSKIVAIDLEISASPLDEVQYIAYGKTSKRLNTGNVVSVKAADIEKQPVTNPLLALQGRVPGLQVTQENGLPGTGVTVRIRGRNSLENGNDPLYLIDGVPFLNQMLPGLNSPITGLSGGTGPDPGRKSGSPLSYINPLDIESIEVLKDADATAIYGTRGANGVILITTKKGKAGPMRVDLNFQQGWGKVTRFIPWLNTRQYLDMRYEAFRNDGIDVSILTPRSNNYDLTMWDTTSYTDWNKELIGGTSRYSDIQLSLYGGSNNMQYRVGYNYNKQTTVFPGSFGDPKGSLSFSVGSSSNNKKLNISLSGNYQLDKNELPTYDLSGSTNLAPNAPSLRKDDGSLNWADDPITGLPTFENPLATLNSKYRRKVNNLITNAAINYEFILGLDVRVNAGYVNVKSAETRINPSTIYAPVYASSMRPYLTSEFGDSENDTWIVEPQIRFEKHLLGGTLSALVGSTWQQDESKGKTITAQDFNSDLAMEDAKAAGSITIDYSFANKYKYNAVFARVNYSYGDKYLLNLTARRDGTSRFGPEKRFANFGAAGGGWIFSKEKWISNIFPFLSFGKIRASYGTTGSDQVGDYRYLNLYNYQNFDIPYQESRMLFLDGLFNPQLAWEETKKFEAGIELGFFRDRILLSSSHYRNRSSNQLTSYLLPANTGAASIFSNLEATIENIGWEISISAINVQSKNFRWRSSLNVTVPRDKLISVSSGAASVNKALVGHSMSTVFVYQYAGVDAATGVYQFFDEKGSATFRPDTAVLIPGTFTRSTQRPLYAGVNYYGGLQNSFSWKGLQLDFLFQFENRLGISNRHGSIAGYFSQPARQNQPVSVLGRWQNPGDIASLQKFSQNGNGQTVAGNSLYNFSNGVYMDASYIRLKNVALSWNFPSLVIRRLRLQNARLYTQAQNVFAITKYKGSDVETRSLTSLPPLRMWTVGCQITF